MKFSIAFRLFSAFSSNSIVSFLYVLGFESRTVYIALALLVSVLLDVAVFVTGTPFPLEKLGMNTWAFITLGLMMALWS